MILAILQARLSSSRLPGKVLAPVLGEPMVMRQLERLAFSTMIDRLVVATSSDPSDDALANVLASRGIEVRRGPLDDVLRRFAMVVDEFQPETIVRLTADCPLADVTVIDRVITSHVQSGADYTSNTITPTFPDGLDVECIGAKAFARLVARPLTVREREHVTMGIYSRPDDFSLNSVVQEHDRSALRWTVDVAEDLEFVRAVYNELYIGNPRFEQEDVMELIRTQPALNRTGDDVARNAGSAQ